jgi:hypothetical protein
MSTLTLHQIVDKGIIKSQYEDKEGRCVKTYANFNKNIAFIYPEQQQEREDYILIAVYVDGTWWAERLVRLAKHAHSSQLPMIRIEGPMEEALNDAKILSAKRDNIPVPIDLINQLPELE